MRRWTSPSGPRLVFSVVLATRSDGKRRELVPLLAEYGVGVDSLDAVGVLESPAEDALECFATFEENALAKARWFHALLGDRVVIADDSGLEVDALFGAPGVHSKRWSAQPELTGAALDAANNARLLDQLTQAYAAGRASRRARYVCAAACVWSGGELVVRGTTDGTILTHAIGTGGFGYDPYFHSDDLGMSFAESSRSEKARVSHRGRAFTTLVSGMRSHGLIARGDHNLL